MAAGLAWALANASVELLGSGCKQESYRSFFLLSLRWLEGLTLPKYVKHEQTEFILVGWCCQLREANCWGLP